ncbi:MAG: hypothetical protein V7784_04000 [Oceanospirillaceae bacterium]
MQYQSTGNTLKSYLFKHFEMAFSFAIILWVAVAEQWLEWPLAVAVFSIVLIYRGRSVFKDAAEINSRKLTIDGEKVTLTSATSEQVYAMQDFKILLFKRRAKKVAVFVIMSEDKGFKIEHYKDMERLFEIFSQKVPMCKKIPWWQRL